MADYKKTLNFPDTPFPMLHTWHELPQQAGEAELLDKWLDIRNVRAEVSKALEDLRAAGKIGSSLQAQVEIRAAGERAARLASLGDDLRFVLITSAATVSAVAEGQEAILAEPTPAPKCERCWHQRADVGANPDHPQLCGRCVANLFGDGESRHHGGRGRGH